MNDPTLMPDDPKLTAYALGELSGDERAHVEAALRENPALRATVEEIRAAAAQIEAALVAEALEDVDEIASPAGAHGVNGHALAGMSEEAAEAESMRIFPGRDSRYLDGGDYARPAREGKLLRFPQLYVLIASAAAACFAIFVYLRHDEYTTSEQVVETRARIDWRKREAGRLAQSPPVVAVTIASAPTPPSEEVKPAAPPSGSTELATAEPPSSAPKMADVPPTSPRVGAPAPTTPATLAAVTEAPPAANSDTGLSLLELSRSDVITPRIVGVNGPAVTVGPVTRGTTSATSLARNATTPSPVSKADSTPTVASSGALSYAATPRAKAFTTPAGSPAANDDIVRLDTFEVSADRLPNMLMSFATITRGIPEPEPLPRPPLGGQFGSAREIATFPGENDFVRVADSPTSRFSVDIDTSSYAGVRRLLEQGTRPGHDAVRIEELVNYFPYNYATPKNDQAFAASLEVASAPWAPERRLVRIGLKARETAQAHRGPANFVFVLDVSASPGDSNKLPLMRESVRVLVNALRPTDRVAIVTYASTAVVALRSTPAAQAGEIFAALNALKPGGAGDGAGGLQLAYAVAVANYAPNGANRVLLCSEGAFNAGAAGEHELLRLIDEKTRSGIGLTVVGFGRGRDQGTPLERLARRASASYGYVDSAREAEKLMVDQVARSLATVARDVKVQVDFNPARVLAYRLVGYENRPLLRELYSDEATVVGEVGAGQAVTALYEIVPALPGDTVAAKPSDYVKYGAEGAVSSRLEMPDTRRPPGNELLAVHVGYKLPNSLIGWPRTQDFAVTDAGAQFADASADFRFAAAVAEFGMILRGSPHRGKGTMRDVVTWANAATTAKDDPRGYRRDFVRLARQAQGLYR